MKTFYQIKGMEAEVKDIDFKSRTVQGYYSRFGNVDYDKDMMLPGSTIKTVKERGREGKNIIPHILDHYMITENVVSKPKLYEVQDGAMFESVITDTTKGDNLLKQYRDGLISQHSFGYKVLRSEDKTGYRAIKEIMLFEISSVVLGANPETPFTGFKALGQTMLLDRYKHLQKCFRNGDYTDDYMLIMEKQLLQMQEDLIELLVKDTSTEPVAPEGRSIQPELNVKNLLIILNT